MKKPVDDIWFNTLSSLDWQYYQAQINADTEEEHEKMLGYIEYLASYDHPKTVANMKDRRKNKATESGYFRSSDEQFEKQVSKLFGRPLKLKENR